MPTTIPNIASSPCLQREGRLPTSISLIFTPPPTIAANNATTPITSRIAPVVVCMPSPLKLLDHTGSAADWHHA